MSQPVSPLIQLEDTPPDFLRGPVVSGSEVAARRHIHLLYVPTVYCNLDCSYCYLGQQTSTADLKLDITRAVSTLRFALEKFEAANVLPFNVSLHGGEVTTLPVPVLDELFTIIRGHYRQHFDELNALGYRKAAPHIKTNLFRFAPLLELFRRHKVSVSASIDLPLALHDRYRLRRDGKGWRDRTEENLRLLAAYPHNSKISATLSAVHLEDVDAIVQDIWYIHRELGFDMNNMNLMFAFESALNSEDPNKVPLQPVHAPGQLALYHALHEQFMGTELEEGLRRNWFDEFSPSYCTNAFNCGEKFYLLQSDGNVYSCVRGQGIPEFHYGNIFTDSVEQILQTGAHKISLMHQRFGFDEHCQGCGHLSTCHTGCAVVKFQRQHGQSYTCDLQRQMYADQPLSFPADPPEEQREYAAAYAAQMHPTLHLEGLPTLAPQRLVLPNDLYDEKNELLKIIEQDETLQQLYREDAFLLEHGGEVLALASQILKPERLLLTVAENDPVGLHVHRDLLAGGEAHRNTLYVQLLRDSPVVYGDEARTKQAHLFTYQLWLDHLLPSSYSENYLYADLGPILRAHSHLYQRGVLNNLLVTTSALRDYHYLKQKNNAFYHIQAINLPFQNAEFYYLKENE
ncbi:radical SAM protein [Deinococcus fonticola]|uniref:radical SAM protein n=1 Tax=Deinococcus fonticola TaxID=2528713 RepID=UPI00197AE616|nr:SPASM domain-containing protein [Deinococcus fonticola]